VAVGYTLDEITNDITRQTKAAFEPSLDYVVVKIPRWAFEKFTGVDPTLGPQMKSVGEAMALGRTFPEALNKAIQSLEIGVDALDGSGPTLRQAQGDARSLPAAPVTLDMLKFPPQNGFSRFTGPSGRGFRWRRLVLQQGTIYGFWLKCKKSLA
jgi:hypothetical protein